MSDKFQNLTDEELQQLAMEAIDGMSAKGRAELLEWVKKEFPELENHEE